MSRDLHAASVAPLAAGGLDRPPGDTVDGITGLAMLVGAGAAIAAGATSWLVLTEPVTVARGLDSGELAPLLRSLAAVLHRAIAAALDYL